jgi:NAD(P)-dependent dehydrogenase (short-subunit alcohol dehydrogenase family)
MPAQAGDGPVAIVTGSGSGIGRACAERLAGDGYSVVVNDISAQAAAETADLISDNGGRVAVAAGDVGDEESVVSIVRQTVDEFARVDVLVNNAGYGLPGTVAGTDDETLEEMMRVNVKGVLHGIRGALPIMISQQAGAIINVASMAALASAADRAAYGASKSAVLALTRSAAVENARHGIRVNAICPGPVHTRAFERFVPDYEFYRNQLPMRRLADPAELAAVVAFLAGPDSTYVSGVALPVDGAMGARLPAPLLSAEQLTS